MPDHRPALAHALARLQLLGYPNAPGPGRPADAWVAVMQEALEAAPVGEVEAALRAYLVSTEPQDRYMPTPGRILALCPARVAMLSAVDRGGERWEALLRVVGRLGVDRCTWAELRAHWPTPLGEADFAAVVVGAVAVGGLRAIGHAPEPGRLRGAFLRAYEAHLSAASQSVVRLAAAGGPALTVAP